MRIENAYICVVKRICGYSTISHIYIDTVTEVIVCVSLFSMSEVTFKDDKCRVNLKDDLLTAE